ncbi:MAG: alkaline phosphatase [Bacteroidales bacterium]
MKTNRVLLALLISASAVTSLVAQEAKNVIFMIPDGTSSSVLAISRWYQQKPLAVDPHICGQVITHCSDSPIGDSAPTGATYATGVLARTGNISIYPEQTPNDLVKVDPSRTYQPAFTLLEEAKLQGRSTGLIFTCQLPHATPADFASHGVNRNEYNSLTKQMVYNNIDVVFGGGHQYLTPSYRDDKENLFTVLDNQGVKFVRNKTQFEAISTSNKKVWGLFAPDALPFEDERVDSVPSIAAMTEKAIDILSKNKDGFFLMVEGSKVDWAAHANDTKGVITEYLAFDQAVAVALEFAKKDKNTLVVVVPDHGNGGVSLGNQNSNGVYSKTAHSAIFHPLQKLRVSEHMSSLISPSISYDNYLNILTEEFGMKISDEDGLATKFNDVQSNLELRNMPQYNDSLSVYEKRIANAYRGVNNTLIKINNKNGYIGWTTSGHEGENVFLATYAPKSKIGGVVQNSDVNKFVQHVGGLNLEGRSDYYFTPANKLFDGYEQNWDETNPNYPILTVTNRNNGKSLKLEAYRNYYTLDGKQYPLQKKGDKATTIIGFTHTKGHKSFYVPTYLVDLLK